MSLCLPLQGVPGFAHVIAGRAKTDVLHAELCYEPTSVIGMTYALEHDHHDLPVEWGRLQGMPLQGTSTFVKGIRDTWTDTVSS